MTQIKRVTIPHVNAKQRKFQKLYDDLNALDISVWWFTAQDAQNALENMVQNRNLNKNRVLAYAEDMIAGAWLCTGAPLVQLDNGMWADCQHRLWAVIEADKAEPGISVPFLVVSGVSVNDVKAIDNGQQRSVSQILAMGGERNVDRIAATALAIATAPGMQSVRVLSTQQRLGLFEKYKELATWVCGVSQFRGSTRGYRAAIARASFYIPREKLESFCAVVANGVPADGMSAAEYEAPLVLRRYFESVIKYSGTASDVERYQKSVAAIKLWDSRTRCTRLYGLTEDPFPLKGEK